MRNSLLIATLAVMAPLVCTAETKKEAESIAWFGTWEGGLAEAKRTGRPILLVAAAPHCHNVPGVW